MSATMNANNKINDFKCQMSKCDTVQDMFTLIRSFLETTEESNVTLFRSILESSETTIFDPHGEETIFDIQKQPQIQTQTSPVKKLKNTSAYSTPSSLPATPTTSRPDLRKARRPTSVESKAVSDFVCKKCVAAAEEKKSLPVMVTKIDEKFMRISVETQTDLIPDDTKDKENEKEVEKPAEEKAEIPAAVIPIPPPLPAMIPKAPALPMFNGLSNGIPGPPIPPPFPFPSNSTIPGPPPLPSIFGKTLSTQQQSGQPGKLTASGSATSSTMPTTLAEKPKPFPLPAHSEWYQTNSECGELELRSRKFII